MTQPSETTMSRTHATVRVGSRRNSPKDASLGAATYAFTMLQPTCTAAA